MKPLSQKKRLTYFFTLVLVFLIGIPIIFLYAVGYRVGSGFTVFKSGGIFVHTDLSGAIISLSGSIVDHTSLFQKDAFIENLAPGNYSIDVYKEGYQKWNQEVVAYPERVTWTYAFMMPEELQAEEIPRFLSLATTTVASTIDAKKTESEINPDYELVVKIFVPKISDDDEIATTTKTYRKTKLIEDDGGIYVLWTGGTSNTPYYFCDYNNCVDKLEVYKGKYRNFDFYSGKNDVVVIARDNGIYTHQISSTGKIKPQTVFVGTEPSFVIDDDVLYIKDGQKYYSLEL